MEKNTKNKMEKIIHINSAADLTNYLNDTRIECYKMGRLSSMALEGWNKFVEDYKGTAKILYVDIACGAARVPFRISMFVYKRNILRFRLDVLPTGFVEVYNQHGASFKQKEVGKTAGVLLFGIEMEDKTVKASDYHGLTLPKHAQAMRKRIKRISGKSSKFRYILPEKI